MLTRMPVTANRDGAADPCSRVGAASPRRLLTRRSGARPDTISAKICGASVGATNYGCRADRKRIVNDARERPRKPRRTATLVMDRCFEPA
jgi:hypothetical protein